MAERIKVGILVDVSRNLCTSTKKRHRQELYWLEGTSLLLRISLKRSWQPFSKRIQMHSFRIWVATGQEIPANVYQPLTCRVWIQARGVSAGATSKIAIQHALTFLSRQIERAA